MSRPRGLAILGYAVTALHPGVGRAPGVVDLPVQRDPMGYPMVYASSVKGAFKAECGRRINNAECLDTNKEGRLDCNKCPLCCCLFGHEMRGEPAASLLSVLDMVPLFFPVPSLSHGYLYVTTPYLAARATAILEAIGQPLDGLLALLQTIRDLGSELKEGKAIPCPTVSNAGDSIYIGSTELKTIKTLDETKCNSLQTIAGLGGLASSITSRLVVVSNEDGPTLIEKGLIRLTRIRLRIDTKTVTGGALWTEEYIPQGTIFLSGFITLIPRSNNYCCKKLSKEDNCIITSDDDVNKLLTEFISKLGGDNCTTYAIIGGKETIGKGMLLLKLEPCQSVGADKQRVADTTSTNKNQTSK